MTIAFMGIDLAKNVFQLHGVNADGKAVFKKRVRREGLLAELADIPACRIGIEACTGAFWWQRQFEGQGHTVKVIAPQYVKPFLKHQKNDRNDAEAICTALMQPNMKFVPPKNEEQQDIQALHRARRRLVNHRTALVCQMRGLILDRGVTIPLTLGRAWQRIPEILEDRSNGLTGMSREIIVDLFEFMLQLDGRVNSIRERRGMNRAIVAVANKNARIIWAMLRRNEEFRAHA